MRVIEIALDNNYRRHSRMCHGYEYCVWLPHWCHTMESVYPKVLLPYKFSKLRPIKYWILTISHQKQAVKYWFLVINHQIVRIS